MLIVSLVSFGQTPRDGLVDNHKAASYLAEGISSRDAWVHVSTNYEWLHVIAMLGQGACMFADILFVKTWCVNGAVVSVGFLFMEWDYKMTGVTAGWVEYITYIYIGWLERKRHCLPYAPVFIVLRTLYMLYGLCVLYYIFASALIRYLEVYSKHIMIAEIWVCSFILG